MAELVTALVLLGVAIVLAVRLAGAVAADRVASDQRRLALAEVQNALERLSVLTTNELASDAADLSELAERVARELPNGRLTVRRDPAKGPPATVRLHAEVAWTDRHGQPVAPVGLTTWAFGTEDASP